MWKCSVSRASMFATDCKDRVYMPGRQSNALMPILSQSDLWYQQLYEYIFKLQVQKNRVRNQLDQGWYFLQVHGAFDRYCQEWLAEVSLNGILLRWSWIYTFNRVFYSLDQRAFHMFAKEIQGICISYLMMAKDGTKYYPLGDFRPDSDEKTA